MLALAYVSRCVRMQSAPKTPLRQDSASSRRNSPRPLPPRTDTASAQPTGAGSPRCSMRPTRTATPMSALTVWPPTTLRGCAVGARGVANRITAVAPNEPIRIVMSDRCLRSAS